MTEQRSEFELKIDTINLDMVFLISSLKIYTHKISQGYYRNEYYEGTTVNFTELDAFWGVLDFDLKILLRQGPEATTHLLWSINQCGITNCYCSDIKIYMDSSNKLTPLLSAWQNEDIKMVFYLKQIYHFRPKFPGNACKRNFLWEV